MVFIVNLLEQAGTIDFVITLPILWVKNLWVEEDIMAKAKMQLRSLD